jgi:hypothetical protein
MMKLSFRSTRRFSERIKIPKPVKSPARFPAAPHARSLLRRLPAKNPTRTAVGDGLRAVLSHWTHIKYTELQGKLGIKAIFASCAGSAVMPHEAQIGTIGETWSGGNDKN